LSGDESYRNNDKELQASWSDFVKISSSEQINNKTNIKWDNKGTCRAKEQKNNSEKEQA
jgi:hypothetical protein